MDLRLTPQEIEQFRDALLSAFTRKSDLEQVVLFGLGEHLDSIVNNGPLRQVATELVIWANNQEKVSALLERARQDNPGNPTLREFEARIRARLSPQAPGPAGGAALTPALRTQLIDALLKLPVTDSYLGRSSLLQGIPAHGLNRDPNNRQNDLGLIISQLEQLGRLATGEWPLILLIDNALPPVRDFEVGEDLQEVRKALIQAYEQAR